MSGFPLVSLQNPPGANSKPFFSTSVRLGYAQPVHPRAKKERSEPQALPSYRAVAYANDSPRAPRSRDFQTAIFYDSSRLKLLDSHAACFLLTHVL